jgi:hypothetical protein
METAATWTEASDPVTSAMCDPFTVPPASHPIEALVPRSRAVVAGIVVRAEEVRWVGGPVLEVDLQDQTGTLTLALFGRHEVCGVHPGALLTVAGAVGRRDGRLVILNPGLWLNPEPTAPDVGDLRPSAGTTQAAPPSGLLPTR